MSTMQAGETVAASTAELCIPLSLRQSELWDKSRRTIRMEGTEEMRKNREAEASGSQKDEGQRTNSRTVTPSAKRAPPALQNQLRLEVEGDRISEKEAEEWAKRDITRQEAAEWAKRMTEESEARKKKENEEEKSRPGVTLTPRNSPRDDNTARIEQSSAACAAASATWMPGGPTRPPGFEEYDNPCRAQKEAYEAEENRTKQKKQETARNRGGSKGISHRHLTEKNRKWMDPADMYIEYTDHNGNTYQISRSTWVMNQSIKSRTQLV